MVLGKWHALGRGSGLLARVIRLALAAHGPGDGLGASGGEAAAAPLDIGASSGLTIARTYAAPLLGPVATGGVVLVFTVFIMMAGDDLSDRLVRLVGRHDLHRTILAMNDAAKRLSRFFLYQLGLNAAFGVLIGSCLWGVGLPNPVLWGILAGLMRFVPYIGVLVALAPPVLLAVAVAPGWTLAVVVLALFVGSEVVTGQLVEPLVYGHSTGLSPLAVIVATAFWALLWGTIGLLIATPLTLCLVVLGRHVEALAFIDVIFGDKPPLDPPETFYQRALEEKALKLVPAARRQVEVSSLTEYYDTVALPGLALAQSDLLRDALAFERLEAIHAQIDGLLTRVVEGRSTGARGVQDGSRRRLSGPVRTWSASRGGGNLMTSPPSWPSSPSEPWGSPPGWSRTRYSARPTGRTSTRQGLLPVRPGRRFERVRHPLLHPSHPQAHAGCHHCRRPVARRPRQRDPSRPSDPRGPTSTLSCPSVELLAFVPTLAARSADATPVVLAAAANEATHPVRGTFAPT